MKKLIISLLLLRCKQDRRTKAAILLAEKKYRINEISYMVGFNNPSYFAKCFQKQFGLKPGEFLRKGEKSDDA